MNVLERVERARRRLRWAEIVAGILEALAVAGAVFVAMAIVDALFTLPLVIRMTAPPLAMIAAVALLSQRFARRRTDHSLITNRSAAPINQGATGDGTVRSSNAAAAAGAPDCVNAAAIESPAPADAAAPPQGANNSAAID